MADAGYKDGAHFRLVSRNGVDHTRRFNDIAAAISKLSARTLVTTARWPCSTSSSGPASRREPDLNGVATPPLLMVFDIVFHNGRDLCARPLRDRRVRLEDVVAGSELVFPVRRLAAARA
jgi:ATP-dependent DNA ligase